VSLSGFARNYREQFVAALRRVKEILAEMPSVTLIRGDPALDAVLAKRLTAVAQKATGLARLIQRGQVLENQ
jgi:hypothetical protein